MTTYLSYSGYKLFASCPHAFWHRYINKTVLKDAENGVNTLYGSTIGNLFETFYVDRVWKRSDYMEYLDSLVPSSFQKAVKDQQKQGRVLDWGDEKSNYKSPEALLTDVRNSIPDGVQTIRANRLLGPRMDAEFKLDMRFGRYMIGGRADFIIKRTAPFNDLVILDGKGSKWRDKYVDGKPRKKGAQIEGTQLKWYATLFREQTGDIPDGLGYIFWKFKGEEAVEWINFSGSDLSLLKEEVLSTLSRIDQSAERLKKLSGKPQAHDELQQELFPTQASEGNCRLCSYLSICEDGKKKMQQGGPRRAPRINLPKGVEELSLGVDDD